MQFRPATRDELTIDDRAPLTGVAIYQRLETFLRGSGHRFLIPEAGQQASWDRALFLNLTYWNVEAGADVILFPVDTAICLTSIRDAVITGRVTHARIDESVRRILRAKAKLDLHRNRFTDMERVTKVVGSAENQRFARMSACLNHKMPHLKGVKSR